MLSVIFVIWDHLAKTGPALQYIVHDPFCNHANNQKDQLKLELNFPGPEFKNETQFIKFVIQGHIPYQEQKKCGKISQVAQKH